MAQRHIDDAHERPEAIIENRTLKLPADRIGSIKNNHGKAT